MIRVLIADEQRAFAEALALRLGVEPGLEVVGVAVHREEALRATSARPVDVAVMDVDRNDGFVALGDHLQAVNPHVALVGLSAGDDVAVLTRAVQRGFRGWVPKEAALRDLLGVLHAVHRGETCIPPLLLTALLQRLLQEQATRRAADVLLSSLTMRERQVLQAMSRGAGAQEIAEQLGISPHTVRTHTQNILAKLDVHTSLAAVRLARATGLL
jgi:DNA-binding NarL/FixJ family response regulator